MNSITVERFMYSKIKYNNEPHSQEKKNHLVIYPKKIRFLKI